MISHSENDRGDSVRPADGLPDLAAEPLPLKTRLIDTLKRHRLPLLLVGHLVIFCFIYYFALVIRYETIRIFQLKLSHNPSVFRDLVLFGLPFIALTKLVVFYAMKNFHGWWRYVTFSDLLSLGKASLVSMAVIILIDHFLLPFQIPRKVVLMDCALTIVALSGLRSIWRIWDEQFAALNPNSGKRKRALLIGEDYEAARLAHLINSRANVDFKVVGLVSREKMKPVRYSSLRVVGCVQDIATLVKTFRARTIQVGAGSLPAKQLRSLMDFATQNEIKINVLPKLSDLLQGHSQIPIREVQVDDLLRRPAAKLDLDSIQRLVENKTILVTGAGGSIGSELCRQIMKYKPARLVLLGRGENRIYQIHRELKVNCGDTELIPALATITDRHRMDQIVDEHRPNVIFHAAAHKHVPLTENNIGEAVINNVYGTRVIAELADQYHVSKFVFVSTDKAVNPTSVMGCTKHIAERFCLAMGNHSKTQFVVTRFGNVLGSAGSVVPLFKEQIRRGGPITVTDPRMTRFFMTIPEAASLVVQAAAMGDGGEIFVLEMGQPVLIADLAKDLIRLAGLPPGSIDIVYTGIRPGEKLYEELYYNDEKSLPTNHEKILTAYHRPFELDEVSDSIDALLSIAYQDPETIRQKMMAIVPEFGPDQTADEDLPSHANGTSAHRSNGVKNDSKNGARNGSNGSVNGTVDDVVSAEVEK